MSTQYIITYWTKNRWKLNSQLWVENVETVYEKLLTAFSVMWDKVNGWSWDFLIVSSPAYKWMSILWMQQKRHQRNTEKVECKPCNPEFNLVVSSVYLHGSLLP